ncbi:hypothetical protein P20311_1026 [Pseudoalteromonas sp. BSi20311]|nr:hypothetical protein P20311_1026 [Pseudoalteromonas sp. BSi20311]
MLRYRLFMGNNHTTPHHIGSALPKYQTDCCKFNLEGSTDPNLVFTFKIAF